MVTKSSNHTNTFKSGVTVGANPNATGSYERAGAEGISSMKKQFRHRISQFSRRGVTWWGFDEEDTQRQIQGTILEGPELPTATFDISSGGNKNKPLPEDIEIEVASYFTIYSGSIGNKPWFKKMLKPFKKSSVSPYSHLCHTTVLNIPTDLNTCCYYVATVDVESTGQDLQFKSNIEPGFGDSDTVKIKNEVKKSTSGFKYSKYSFFMTYQMSENIFLVSVRDSSLPLTTLRGRDPVIHSENLQIGTSKITQQT